MRAMRLFRIGGMACVLFLSTAPEAHASAVTEVYVRQDGELTLDSHEDPEVSAANISLPLASAWAAVDIRTGTLKTYAHTTTSDVLGAHGADAHAYAKLEDWYTLGGLPPGSQVWIVAYLTVAGHLATTPADGQLAYSGYVAYFGGPFGVDLWSSPGGETAVDEQVAQVFPVTAGEPFLVTAELSSYATGWSIYNALSDFWGTATLTFDLPAGTSLSSVGGFCQSCPNLPAPPTVSDTNPLSPANNTKPTVNGTAEPGSTVRIYADAACTEPPLASGPATGGAFSIEVTLATDGTYTFYATATNAAGSSPCSATFAPYELDGLPPDPPTLSGPPSPAKGTDITVDAAAEADSLVRLYTSDDCSGDALETETATGGSASFPVTVAANEKTTFSATATDAGGNTSKCAAPYSYAEDSAVTTPAISSSDPVSGSDHNNPKLIGTADPDTTVTIHRQPDCSDAEVAWGAAAIFAGPGIEVAVADNSSTVFHAKAVDAAGNISGCSAGFTYADVTPSGAVHLTGATLDLGLKNSDDIGTAFDLKIEFSAGNTLLGSSEIRCVRNIARSLHNVYGHLIPLDLQLSSGSAITVRVFSRIGTIDGLTRCTGTGASHSSAAGLRFYYDSTTWPSLLSSEAGPLYFHSNGTGCTGSVSTDVTSRTIDAGDTGTITHCQDSPPLKFSGGNGYQQIGGDWTLSVP